MKSPFGMVLSSSTWWRGEWTGLTLILDLRIILEELLNYQTIPRSLSNVSVNNLKSK